MYLKYLEYKALGGKLEEPAFGRFYIRASKEIDIATQNRLIDGVIGDSVMNLCFELINIFENVDSSVKSEKPSSMSNEGVSISFDKTSLLELNKIKNELISTYLYGEKNADGVSLLYLGVK